MPFNHALSQSQTADKKLSAFDTIFKPAVNSPGYVVASKDQVNLLKEFFQNEISNQVKITQIKEKEIYQLTSLADSLRKIKSLESPTSLPSTKSYISSILISIVVVLLFTLIGLFFRGFKTRKELKDGKDSYFNLEKEFDLHKRNAIERERKLMRKVIDLQNELELKSNPNS